ncbi:hypothetical protein BAUCODRAFT_332622 [Baudoinia panamericana UAMH 10762]|uniref:Uncharacterized protein n=1 Tax=Baudoinia panamericana (strain UAMH 10762) TaxID=717646 RepID=M2LAY1_BAUPA|nr:uncharacterized protein BAUCODRAFT_332622 [Baudoinia panamericana UAMH 10762]EMC90972.1 hypothetical protein BAUCODRAFT_332622 [Baudoinia panamericana UAMH 10762]
MLSCRRSSICRRCQCRLPTSRLRASSNTGSKTARKTITSSITLNGRRRSPFKDSEIRCSRIRTFLHRTMHMPRQSYLSLRPRPVLAACPPPLRTIAGSPIQSQLSVPREPFLSSCPPLPRRTMGKLSRARLSAPSTKRASVVCQPPLRRPMDRASHTRLSAPHKAVVAPCPPPLRRTVDRLTRIHLFATHEPVIAACPLLLRRTIGRLPSLIHLSACCKWVTVTCPPPLRTTMDRLLLARLTALTKPVSALRPVASPPSLHSQTNNRPPPRQRVCRARGLRDLRPSLLQHPRSLLAGREKRRRCLHR